MSKTVSRTNKAFNSDIKEAIRRLRRSDLLIQNVGFVDGNWSSNGEKFDIYGWYTSLPDALERIRF